MQQVDYQVDFYAWTREQARLLRTGQITLLDLENLAEELEALGRSEKRELINRLAVLLMHLLKWRYQPTFRGTGWALSIEEQRRQLSRLLRDNPSLKAILEEALMDAYGDARLRAARETGLNKSAFPEACPWDWDQIKKEDFWPEDPLVNSEYAKNYNEER